MVFHGINCNFKALRASDAEKLEKTQADLEAAPKDDGLAASIRYQCAIIDNFFRDVLGEAYAESLNPDTEDLEAMGALFAEFIGIVTDATAAARKNILPEKQAEKASNAVLYHTHGNGKRHRH